MKEISIGNTTLRIFRNKSDGISIEVEEDVAYGEFNRVYFGTELVDAICDEMQRLKKEIEEEKDNEQ